MANGEKLEIPCMSPDAIMQLYRPGSFVQPWSWDAERQWIESGTAMWDDFLNDIQANGIREPVLLGDDGRVWDGHHRIIAAARLGIEDVPYEWGFTR